MLVVEPGIGGAALRGQAPRTSNGKSWVQVAKKGKTSGKGKGVHTKQQHNGAQAVYSLETYANGEKFSVYETVCALFAAVSSALTELEASEDKELMPDCMEQGRLDNKSMGCVELFRGVRNALPKRRSPKRKAKLPFSK